MVWISQVRRGLTENVPWFSNMAVIDRLGKSEFTGMQMERVHVEWSQIGNEMSRGCSSLPDGDR